MQRIYDDALPKVLIAIGMAIATVMLVITLRLILRREVSASQLWKWFVFWTVIPPFWFSFEYFWLFKEYGKDGTFEAFKYGQENAQKFWAAVLALVVARLFQVVQAARIPSPDPDTPKTS